jgi:cytochrome c
VQLTNVTFAVPKFDASGVIKVKGDTGIEATLLVSKAVAGRDVPSAPVNFYGIPVKTGGEWRLLAGRFLPVSGKTTLALATKHICITCHNPDTRLMGPAYRDVAARYRNDPEASAKLIAQMENGGTGQWCPVPMMGFKGKVPPEDMKQIAQWILGYRWDALLAE